MTILDTFDVDGLTVHIRSDEDPINPRTFVTKATFAFKKDHLSDDDAVSVDSKAEFFCRLAGRVDEEFQMRAEEELYDPSSPSVGLYDYPDRIPEDLLDDAHEIIHEHYYWSNIYMYRHGGLALSTSPFDSHWDSGQAGFAYVKKSEIKNMISDEDPEEFAQRLIKNGLNQYGAYLNGDAFGYTVEDDAGERYDSCWGFFDQEYCEKQARESAKQLAAKTDA